MAKVFRNKLTSNELTEADLIKLVEQWESNNSNDYQEIERLEENVNQKIGQSVGEKKVTKIESRVVSAKNSGDKEKIMAVLRDLWVLFNESQDDVYLQNYQNRIQNSIKNLENAISGGKTELSDKGFFQPKYLIPTVLLITIFGVVLTIVLQCAK